MSTSSPSLVRRFLGRVLLGLVLLGLLLFGGTAFRVWQVARVDDRDTADAIVVLGAAQYDGKPSDVFSARLEHAKRLFDDGVSDTVMTVGGRQPKDNYTEAQAGGKYLGKLGVPSENIVTVNEGSDTIGSLRAVGAELSKRGLHNIVLVSDPWHSFRARMMARDLGIDAWTSPTHSGPAVWTRQSQFHSILRETAATLLYRLTRAPADDVGVGG